MDVFNLSVVLFCNSKTNPAVCRTSKFDITYKKLVNPRTDGGPGHLSTDGGGADNRPPEISKRKQARDTR